MKLRYFSIEEAEALIPTLTSILQAAQETKSMIEKKVEQWRKSHKKMSIVDETVVRGQVDFLASQLETQLGEIAELGATPKDLDLGLVDFPARIDGHEAYLCWKMGEEKIKHWHGLTEGYAKRKSIKKRKNG